jgi:cell division protein FtsB
VRVPVDLPAESKPAAWLRGFRLSGFALSTLLLVVASLVVLAPSLKTLVEQRQQIAELQADVDDAEQAVDELGGEIDRWRDPAYITSVARDKLYYVMPGDVTYLVKGDGDPVAEVETPVVSDEIQETEVDWVRAMAASLFTAGLTDASAQELESPVQLQTPGQ